MPSGEVRLWFVRDDGLAPVVGQVVDGRSDPGSVVSALLELPAEGTGLRTLAQDPLTNAPLVTVVGPEQEPASGSSPLPVVVALAPGFTALSPTEQVLLLGQVVLSVTGAGFSEVSFVDQSGALAAVPLPDGRLLDRPAVARDYASLIVQT